MKIAIIGAGITGLSTAYYLSQKGYTVTIYEQSDHAGGLGSSLRVGGTAIERFYHHLFRSDVHAIQLLTDLGLRSQLKFYPAKTSVLTGKRLFPFSSPIDLLQFSALSFFDRIRLGYALVQLKFLPQRMKELDTISAASWLKRHAGSAAYNILWKPLLVGKFANFASAVPTAWLRDRLRDRSFDLGYLDGGAQTLFDALLKHLKKQRVRIRYGTTVTAVKEINNSVQILVGERSEQFDRCLITTVSPIASRLITSPISQSIRKQLDQQDQLGAVCLLLELDRSIQNQYWVNICNPSSPVLVMVEHTNMISPERYGGNHVVYLANYIHRTKPEYRQSDEQIISSYTSILKQLNPSFSPAWIRNATVSRSPRAQTIFGLHSFESRPPHRLTDRIFLGNIDQMYPHDRNFNLGVEMGEKLATLIS